MRCSGQGSGGGVVVKNRPLVALGLVSLGLLLLAIVDPWQRQESTGLGRILDGKDAASLIRVVIRSESGETQEVSKSSRGRWQTFQENSAVKDALADPAVVRQLISAMTLLRASRQAVPVTKHEFAAGGASIHYESASGVIGDIVLGALSADAQHRWIRLGEDGKALLVEAHLIEEILDTRTRLRSRRLLPPRPPSGARLHLKRGEQWLQVKGRAMTWTGHEVYAAKVSATRLAALRDALGALEFLEPLPDPEMCAASKASVVIDQGDASLEIRECGPCANELVALSTGPVVGCVRASHWKVVQQAIDAPLSLVDRAVLPTRRPEGAFTLRCEQEELRVDPEEVDAQRLRQWWQAIDSGALAVEQIAVPSTRCTLTGEDYQVSFGRIEDSWYAQRTGSSPAPPGLARRLKPELTSLLRVDASLFQSLDLLTEDPLFATHIHLEQGGTSVELQRSELLDAWQSTGGTLSDALATEWALALRAELASLRAERFASERLDSERAKKARRIAIDFENPVTGATTHYDLLVLVVPLTSECLVQINAGAVAWIAPKRCQALLSPMPTATSP